MIPSKLLLRALTVMALTRGGEAPFPTMAGEGVFDTKLRPITDLAQESMVPIVIVYTDLDQRQNRDRNTTRSWKRKVNLVIELAMGAIGKEGFEYAEADSELEAMMDLFELEVETALHDPTNKWSVEWRKMISCMDEWEVTPYRSADQQARYAVRQILVTCEIAADCMPKPTIGTPVIASTTDKDGRFIPGSLLPIPYLAEFEATVLAQEEIFQATRAILTGAAHQPVVPALRGVYLHGDFIDPADPNRLPAGQTTGPDGREEVSANIEGLNL